MVMAKDFASVLGAVILLCRIDCELGIVVRLELTAFDILDPATRNHVVDAHPLVGVWVKHL